MSLSLAAARLVAGASARLRGPRLSVLIFHRVLPEPDPLFPGEMDRARFERCMRLLQRCFHVLPLSEAIDRVADGRLPPRAAAITFDDGYADNHGVAWPVLRALGLPATIFVSSGFLDGGRMWNDTLIECLRRTQRTVIDLNEFGLDRAPLHSWEQRRAAIHRLIDAIKYMTPGDRAAALERVQRATEVDALPSTLMMRSDQVREMHASGVEIGAHTISHPILRSLPDEEAEREIVGGRTALESVLQAPVSLFAFPNGRPGRDFAPQHVEMIRRQRFRAAFTTASGVAQPGDDLMQLSRFTPWDRDPRRWIVRLAVHHASN